MMDPASPQPTDASALLRALVQAALQAEPPIDATEAAAMMRCTPEQVEELVRDGELPATKIGRSWIFLRSVLLDHLARRSLEEMVERRAKRQAAHQQDPKSARDEPPQLRPVATIVQAGVMPATGRRKSLPNLDALASAMGIPPGGASPQARRQI